MPFNLCGTWDMLSNVNFEGYMIALGTKMHFYIIIFSVRIDYCFEWWVTYIFKHLMHFLTIYLLIIYSIANFMYLFKYM